MNRRQCQARFCSLGGAQARKRNTAVAVIRPQADAGLFTDKLLILAVAAPAGKSVADLAQPPDLAPKGAAAAAKKQMQAQIEALAAAEGAVEAVGHQTGCLFTGQHAAGSVPNQPWVRHCLKPARAR